ncbi:MAG: hypothetical protein VW831_12985, partial [Gammaproteobacteria bacterium]
QVLYLYMTRFLCKTFNGSASIWCTRRDLCPFVEMYKQEFDENQGKQEATVCRRGWATPSVASRIVLAVAKR